MARHAVSSRMPDTPSDEALVAAYLDEADDQAFRQLVERYQNQIFGYIM